MISLLRNVASGLYAHQFRVDVIAHNLSNINTQSFKRSRILLKDTSYLPFEFDLGELASEIGVEGQLTVGQGVQVAEAQRVWEQGVLAQTDQPLDLAVIGEGFFMARLPDGETAYVRGGPFAIDADGRLVTDAGLVLLPEIQVPEDTIEMRIDSGGCIFAIPSDGTEGAELGTLTLARFANASGLQSLGGGLFLATEASGEAQVGAADSEGYGIVVSGALESSNVDMVEEMTQMLQAQRAYQITLKALQALDEMLGQANSIRR